MEISITRALNELKLLDKRITKEISSTNFLTYEVAGKPADRDFKAKENLQSIETLIERRRTIKAKIMESNATTKVVIGDVTMTVVEAIELKESIKYKKILLEKLNSNVKSTRKKVEDINEEVGYRLDKLLEANFGKESKTKDSELDAISKPFLAKNEAKEIDEIKIDEKIDSLDKEIDNFESEVDFILSESNSLTRITIN